MDPLFVAIAVSAPVALGFGVVLACAAAFAKSGASSIEHPWLATLARRRNPLVNILGTLIAWSVVLYFVPKFALALVDVSDVTALVLVGFLQLCFFGLGLLAGDRVWKAVQ